MNPSDSKEKSAMHLPNNTGQQVTSSPTSVEYPPVYDRQMAMKLLAEMSMPVDAQTMITNVDTVIAGAMQTINDSLKRSSHYIDAAREQLMQAHPALKQAYDPHRSAEEAPTPSATTKDGSMPPAAPIDALKKNVLHEWDKDSKDYQSKVLSEHEIQQKQAMARQAAISKTAADMQQELMAQQQAYQAHILSAAANASTSLTEQTGQEHAHNDPTRAQLTEEDPSSSELQASPSSKLAHQEE